MPKGGFVPTVVVELGKGPVYGESHARPLDARYDLRNHSPDGFAWGYRGSGPAQLALAILCDVMGDDFAQQYYQLFKDKVIAHLNKDLGFSLEEGTVRSWCAGIA